MAYTRGEGERGRLGGGKKGWIRNHVFYIVPVFFPSPMVYAATGTKTATKHAW